MALVVLAGGLAIGDARAATGADTAATECDSRSCFAERFRSCQPATYSAVSRMGTAQYRIVEEAGDGCRVELVYLDNPNPAWIGKPLVCTYDNALDFQAAARQALTSALAGDGGADCQGDLLAALSGNASVAGSTSATPTAPESDPPLVPGQAAGWTRVEYMDTRKMKGAPLTVVAGYTNDDVPYDLELMLAYSAMLERQLEREVEKWSRRGASDGEDYDHSFQRDGHTIHVLGGQHGDKANLSLGVVAGDMSVLLKPTCKFSDGPCGMKDAEAAQEQLLALFDSFDMERLGAFSRPVPDVSGVDAPDGFVPYGTFLRGNVQVVFAIPQGWSVVDVFGDTGPRRQVVAVRDLDAIQAADEAFGNEVLFAGTTARPVGLVTADNALLSVRWLADGADASAEAVSRRMSDGMEQDNPIIVEGLTVAQPATGMSLDGRSALSAVVRGTDASGLAVVHRRIVFGLGDENAYAVDILRPADVSKATLGAVDVFVDSIAVTPRW